ncbi:putative F-box domain-containing protein [Helianthus annuus]|uniref:F-box domain-containing protein n=1 Tax=Helianthus annuus TaxID=4232 RepID=A0A251RNS1_HELAN|nr:F-box/FBD/LRR-repeat protein At1g13570 [Helianthus annuus]XP_022022908.1 F-box/FBD/LRR-repeat protein At1g13570 [Helianthus annuus]KAF5758382.1 putative F-box domain-containing protein [Helianthus annuus]KAJ0436735.1 putative F-box domain, leucine-rich repeat domain superfamily, F-box-like domain superfamily [Helianthus annuus]KAJ0440954.1 putative F-box domain-containing protein [Helianthus annuus]KAJ0459033.1 putative F-box domain, leucine-rich repeat domain superfamily, F-box-like domain
MKTRSMYKAERFVDRISTLPQSILDTILSLLPTEEAARTSILSTEWRYKWTTIPKLWFTLHKRTSELTSDIASTMKDMDMHDVYQVLLLRQGPIHEFALVMDDYWQHYHYFEFDVIILHLSRNHPVKKLRLDGLDGSEDIWSELPKCVFTLHHLTVSLDEFDGSENIWYKLPKSVFALHHLTDLYLCKFHIEHPSIFNGFGSLGSLCLIYVKISTQTLLHLLSNCPSLKNLNLNIDESGDKCTINELLLCLPVIKHLTLSGDVSQWLVLDSVTQELPTSLIHLKSLCLNQSCLSWGNGSALLLALIKCSPNLEDLHLEIECDLDFSAIKDKYSDVWLEHLNELGLCFGSNNLETEFVKFLLARSPKLKKVTILTAVDRKTESKMFKTLLRAPRASPNVIITKFNFLKK